MYSAILHTVQNLGDHGREIDVPVMVTGETTVEELFVRARALSPHPHLNEGADSITLRIVQL